MTGGGFVASAGIDLTTIAFSASTTIGYAPNSGNTGGTITVSDGTHQALITVVGQFAAADFHTASDFSGGTLVTDPTLSGAALTTFLASQHT
jgi:trimeric autotransporter adhesin